MTAKERDRLKVLHEARQRHITQKQAAAELGLSARWVRTLLGRWRAHGDEALRHGLRGRPSNRKTPEAVKRRVVDLYREKKTSEELGEDYGIVISRESLRQWAHVWRAPRSTRARRTSHSLASISHLQA